jgi:N-carbamoyl-L-amino-acid hydrolase
MKRHGPNLERVANNISELSEIVDLSQPGFTRVAFSEYDRRAREFVVDKMETEADLFVRIDPAGNLIGRRRGLKEGPCILIGSHLDTVRSGGKFDGVVGVVSALELAFRFKELSINTRLPIELIVFAAEEPSPFGISCLGSRAVAGDISAELVESLKDPGGRTLRQAIKSIGGDPANITMARRDPSDLFCFIEAHIEQGPILFSHEIPIGVVTGITGIYRGELSIEGRTDHAGTIPMADRVDALCAAAEAILTFESICKNENSLVGTIGTIKLSPNAPNVVPGSATLGLELRSLFLNHIESAASLFGVRLQEMSQKRKVKVDLRLRKSLDPTRFENGIVECIVESCRRLGVSYLEMPSGAGHDAAHVNKICPAGMIFVPSRDGRSHCPEEWSEIRDICLGIEVLAQTVITLDQEGYRVNLRSRP